MRNHGGDYSVEIDSVDKNEWEELLVQFNDANIHQTWSMGAISFGERNLSHLLVRKDGVVIGMAQISIRKLPTIKAGVGRVFWGPLWRRKEKPANYDVLDWMIKALKNEYVDKRGFCLRIWPVGFEASWEKTVSILQNHGFIRKHNDQPYRTLLLSLSPSLEVLRKNLDQKWRNQLNVAEKNNLRVIQGSTAELYLAFLKMVHEMILRKKYEAGVDYNVYERILSDLPEHSKMKIFVCAQEGKAVSAGVVSAIGDTAEYLLGATANAGLRVNGSNLIQWTVINWLKERGCRWYDLGGIDPAGNPGVYRFKLGVAGKSGKEAIHLGQFYLSYNPISYSLNLCNDWINYVRTRMRKRFNLFSRVPR